MSTRAFALLVAGLALALSGCTYVERLSVTPTSGDAQFGGNPSAISQDGRYVVWHSFSADLVPGDDGLSFDVFVRDVRTGQTTRVSLDTSGGNPNASSVFGVISADGRYVAFASFATDIVTNADTNGGSDVFLRDRQTNTTTALSVTPTGSMANGGSGAPSLTPDGRFVAFESNSSDLVTGDGNGTTDVFVRDLQANTTTRVSVDARRGDPNAPSMRPSISADGRYVAFDSDASNLVAGDGNGTTDVFVRDLQTKKTTRVSVDATGGDSNGGSISSDINGDGRYVAFSSEATDLVPGGTTPFGRDVFVRDLKTATTILVSVDKFGGDGGNSLSFNFLGSGIISDDGRYVAFVSLADNLVDNDTNGNFDVFVRDLQTATTRRESVDVLGRQTSGNPSELGERAAISGDGHYVVFDSVAADLVSNDGNFAEDVFIRDVQAPTVAAVAPTSVAPGTTATLTLTGTHFTADTQVSADVLSPPGVMVDSVTFVSPAELTVSVTVDANAALGARNIVVWNSQGATGPGKTSFGLCASCLSVS
jgi:Tol biopolymer transport system component